MFNPFYNNTTLKTLDNRGIYTLSSTGIVEHLVDETYIDYGINPCQWRELPSECVLLWKVKHPVTAAASEFPVNIVVPHSLNSTTVVSENATQGSIKLPVVDNKSTQVVGGDVTVPAGTAPNEPVQTSYTTEHWVYINKCNGTFRLLGVKSKNSPA